ncbi:hypothetical protein F4680DRAFT_450330 [Xylaria scruposa]|nr:hypothetical protein F4680DRAFT_450330 [Xylaria scruposa]
MDPVSALGVAAAAVQFLDASIKAYSAFQEIRSSAESSTERNKQLEDNIRAAQNLRGSLISASTSQGTTDPVTELTARCASKADELLSLLEYVRGFGKNISSIRATLRAVKKGKQIEKLHSSLAEDRVALDQMISQKLLSSIDILTVAQSKEFSNLSLFVQRLIGDLVEQRKAQEVNNDILAGKLDSVRSDVQLRFSEADRIMMREKVLESLFFPEIDQRQSEIKEPAPDTLEWLFGPTSEAGSTSSGESEWYTEPDFDSEEGSENDSASDEGRSQPPWSNFRQWLREDTSMYWMSGKAGSGKSTLMAHIVNDSRTHHDLKIWSEGNELKVLSFFFWRAGTRLQNSIFGLLRSLLYQLCRSNPLLLDNIFARLSSPIGIIPIWTERSLLEHITKAVQSSPGFRFCVFIDGLDEYKGPYDDLIDHISQLQEFGNLKVCASSRPELELVNKFRRLKQLRLQDLNQGDIEYFVQRALTKTRLSLQERTELAKEVIRRAEGVFLWASLVTQSLLKGIMAGDDREFIQKRLNSLPGNMEQLFERMLMDVDVVYRDSLARYVELMMIQQELYLNNKPFAIAIIATMQLEKKINSYEEFANECKNTELWITARSAGLLEIVDFGPTEEYKLAWKNSETKFIDNKPNFMPVNDGLNRCRCAENEPYPAMLKYENRSMKWIHRSAFEFFSNPSEKILWFELGQSREALLQKLSESYISYLIAAPSSEINYSSMTLRRLSICLRFVSSWYDSYPTTASDLLDNISSLYTQFKPDEFFNVASQSLSDPNVLNCTAEVVFWDGCAETGKWSYISSRIHRISKMTAGGSIIAHLLAVLVSRKTGGDFDDLIDSLLEALLHLAVQKLENGAAVHATAYKCISATPRYGVMFEDSRLGYFVCASWREGILDGSDMIMKRIAYIISVLTMTALHGTRLRCLRLFVETPEPLFTLLEVTDLYVAPDLGLEHISVQISAKAWAQYCHTVLLTEKEVEDGDRYIKMSTAFQVPRVVKILCVPSFTKHQPSASITDFEEIYLERRRYPFVEVKDSLKDSQFVSLHPSSTTSDQLLKLFKFIMTFDDNFRFRIASNTLQQRKEVCELLLREIKSAEQGLDDGQQLIAADCLRAGLLDPNIETNAKKGYDYGTYR